MRKGSRLIARVWRYKHDSPQARWVDVLEVRPHPSPCRVGDEEFFRLFSAYCGSPSEVLARRRDVEEVAPLVKKGPLSWELESKPRRCAEEECDDCNDGR